MRSERTSAPASTSAGYLYDSVAIRAVWEAGRRRRYRGIRRRGNYRVRDRAPQSAFTVAPQRSANRTSLMWPQMRLRDVKGAAIYLFGRSSTLQSDAHTEHCSETTSINGNNNFLPVVLTVLFSSYLSCVLLLNKRSLYSRYLLLKRFSLN